jgi:hypothetical protein
VRKTKNLLVDAEGKVMGYAGTSGGGSVALASD